MRRPDLKRALATAVVAAGLSFGGPGALAFAPEAGRLVAGAGQGHQAPDFVARHEARPLRVALHAARRGSPDEATSKRSFLTVLPGPAAALAAPSFSFLEAPRPAEQASRHLVDFVRTSRGPPLG